MGGMAANRERAWRLAYGDWAKGRRCDPGRHGGAPGTLLAQWYAEEYERLRKIPNHIRPYIAKPGSPKSLTKNRCLICGWSPDEAIHTNSHLIGRGGPYHDYVPAEPSPRSPWKGMDAVS